MTYRLDNPELVSAIGNALYTLYFECEDATLAYYSENNCLNFTRSNAIIPGQATLLLEDDDEAACYFGAPADRTCKENSVWLGVFYDWAREVVKRLETLTDAGAVNTGMYFDNAVDRVDAVIEACLNDKRN